MIVLGLDFSEVNLEDLDTSEEIWLVNCDQAVFKIKMLNNERKEK